MTLNVGVTSLNPDYAQKRDGPGTRGRSLPLYGPIPGWKPRLFLPNERLAADERGSSTSFSLAQDPHVA